MNKHSLISDLQNLRLQPLIDGVLHVHPLPYLKLSSRMIKHSHPLWRILLSVDRVKIYPPVEQTLDREQVLRDNLRALPRVQLNVSEEPSSDSLKPEPSVSSDLGLLLKSVDDDLGDVESRAGLFSGVFLWGLLGDSVGDELDDHAFTNLVLAHWRLVFQQTTLE